MSQKKHHYVPRFYLKHFASSPRRINVLNLKDFKPDHDGPLKDQCYRNHLYGLDDKRPLSARLTRRERGSIDWTSRRLAMRRDGCRLAESISRMVDRQARSSPL